MRMCVDVVCHVGAILQQSERGDIKGYEGGQDCPFIMVSQHV